MSLNLSAIRVRLADFQKIKLWRICNIFIYVLYLLYKIVGC